MELEWLLMVCNSIISIVEQIIEIRIILKMIKREKPLENTYRLFDRLFEAVDSLDRHIHSQNC